MCLQRNNGAAQLQHVLVDEVLERAKNVVPGIKQTRAAAKSGAEGATSAGQAVVVHARPPETRQSRQERGDPRQTPQTLSDDGRSPIALPIADQIARPAALQETKETQKEETKMSRGRIRSRIVPKKTECIE